MEVLQPIPGVFAIPQQSCNNMLISTELHRKAIFFITTKSLSLLAQGT